MAEGRTSQSDTKFEGLAHTGAHPEAALESFDSCLAALGQDTGVGVLCRTSGKVYMWGSLWVQEPGST